MLLYLHMYLRCNFVEILLLCFLKNCFTLYQVLCSHTSRPPNGRNYGNLETKNELQPFFFASPGTHTSEELEIVRPESIATLCTRRQGHLSIVSVK